MSFSVEGFKLLRELEANNSKEWFELHRSQISEFVQVPAKRLVEEMQGQLSAILGKELQHKIYRINRDLRFSKDKTPYNPHIRFSFWPIDNEQDQSPNFHGSIEGNQIIVGVGVCAMDAPMVDKFRTIVSNGSFDKLIDQIPDCRMNEPELKKLPSGIECGQCNPDHMRRKTITCWLDFDLPENELSSHDMTQHIKQLVPIYQYLQQLFD